MATTQITSIPFRADAAGFARIFEYQRVTLEIASPAFGGDPEYREWISCEIVGLEDSHTLRVYELNGPSGGWGTRRYIAIADVLGVEMN